MATLYVRVTRLNSSTGYDAATEEDIKQAGFVKASGAPEGEGARLDDYMRALQSEKEHTAYLEARVKQLEGELEIAWSDEEEDKLRRQVFSLQTDLRNLGRWVQNCDRNHAACRSETIPTWILEIADRPIDALRQAEPKAGETAQEDSSPSVGAREEPNRPASPSSASTTEDAGDGQLCLARYRGNTSWYTCNRQLGHQGEHYTEPATGCQCSWPTPPPGPSHASACPMWRAGGAGGEGKGHWSDCRDCVRDGGYCAKHPPAPPPPAEPKLLGPTEQLKQELIAAIRTTADDANGGSPSYYLYLLADKLEARGGR